MRNPLNWPWKALSPQNARSVLNREKSLGATRRSENPSSRMLSLVVKSAPPSSGACVSDAVALPNVCASVLTGIGCADAATGTASTRTHAASSA